MNHIVWAGTRIFVINKDHKVLMVKHRYEEQGNHQVWRKRPSKGFGEE